MSKQSTPRSQGPVPIKNVAGFMAMTIRIVERGPLQPGFGVCSGHSGYGKSMASIGAQNKTGAIRIEVGDTWTRRTVLTAILKELGLSFKVKAALADLAGQVIEALGEEPNRPLIVDEADRLVDKGFIELLRELQEASGAPVIMIGEELLPVKLLQHERVHNRVLDWFQAQPCDLDDTRRLAAAFAPGIEIKDDLLDAIRAHSGGRARRIGNNLSTAVVVARNKNLRTLDLKAWGDTPFNTGEPPKPRPVEQFARKRIA